MRRQNGAANYRGQWTLISVLVSVAIIMALFAVFVPPMLSSHSSDGKKRTPTEAAYSAGCSEYVSQMNMASSMYKSNNGDHPPKSFDDLKSYGVTDSILHARGCLYQLDPNTGVVTDVSRGPRPAASDSANQPNAQSAPVVLSAPADSSGAGAAPASSAPPPNNNPGGVQIPNMSPNTSGF